MTPISKIKSIVGTVDPNFTDILRMRRYISKLPYTRFYEPVSVVDWKSKKRTLINLSAEMMTAWTKHVCFSSRVRMRNFEEAIFSELAAGRLIPTMTLLRAHLEAAGMACLCLSEIRKTTQTGELDSIRELIPATFLGTSLLRAKKKDHVVEELLYLSEQDKVPIGRLISAIDDFMVTDDERSRSHTLYAFLCEYTHPNMRSVRDNISTKNHEYEGWYHLYQTRTKLSKGHYTMALESLRYSMKAGHSTCEMINRTSFEDEDGKGYVGHPTEDDLKEIWNNLLRWPEVHDPATDV